jgi:predicted nucleic-acid-binding Zn-ribbon protein
MRTTHTCPKCSHKEVIFLPQIADRDDDDDVKPLSAHVVHFDWKDDVEVGRMQAYVCHNCGYTELYTNEARQLPWQKVPGAKLLTPADPILQPPPPRTTNS